MDTNTQMKHVDTCLQIRVPNKQVESVEKITQMKHVDTFLQIRVPNKQVRWKVWTQIHIGNMLTHFYRFVLYVCLAYIGSHCHDLCSQNHDKRFGFDVVS